MKKQFLTLLSICFLFQNCNTERNGSNTDTSTVDTSLLFNSVDTTVTDSSISSTNWSYSDSEDKMTSGKTFYASVDATELLQFDFPYDGGTTATLNVRKKGAKTDVYIQFSKAQLIIDSYEGSNFRVRFDKEPASFYSFVGAADHSSDIAFFETTSRFIKNLRKHKKVIIEMQFYQEGTRAIEFNIDGFKWNH